MTTFRCVVVCVAAEQTAAADDDRNRQDLQLLPTLPPQSVLIIAGKIITTKNNKHNKDVIMRGNYSVYKPEAAGGTSHILQDPSGLHSEASPDPPGGGQQQHRDGDGQQDPDKDRQIRRVRGRQTGGDRPDQDRSGREDFLSVPRPDRMPPPDSLQTH